MEQGHRADRSARDDARVQPVGLGQEPRPAQHRGRRVDPGRDGHERERDGDHHPRVGDDPPRHLRGRRDHRQHRHPGGGVVVAVAHGQRPEVRRRPEEDHGEHHERGPADRAGDRGPSDDDRHAPRRAAPHDVLRGAALEQQRVDQHVERDRRDREGRRQQVGGCRQPHRAEHTQCEAEHQRVPRRHPALRERSAGGPLHLDVDVGVGHAVQGVRARRGHRSAQQGGEHEPHRRHPAVREEHRGHGDDEQLLDDAGLGETEVGGHRGARTPQARPDGRHRDRKGRGPGRGQSHRQPRLPRVGGCAAARVVLRPVDPSPVHGLAGCVGRQREHLVARSHTTRRADYAPAKPPAPPEPKECCGRHRHRGADQGGRARGLDRPRPPRRRHHPGLAADAVQKVGNGHPGTAMSLAPLAYTLFQRVMRHDPSDADWTGRDRFVLSCGPLVDHALHPALPLRLRPRDGRPRRRCAPGAPRPPATPSTGTPAASRSPPARWARASPRPSAWRWPPAASAASSTPTPPGASSPFDHYIYVIASRRRHRGGRHLGGVVARGHPGARQPHPRLRRQQDLHRGRHHDRALRGHREALRGLRLARAGRRERRGRHRHPRRASRRPRPRPSRPSFIVLKTVIGWPAPKKMNTVPGARLGAGRRRGRRGQGDPRLRPRRVLRDRRRRARARPRGRASAAQEAHAAWQKTFDAWAAREPERKELFDRLTARELPVGLGEGAADAGSPTRRACPPARPPARC